MSTKKNISEFNRDVEARGGYAYTDERYSACRANERLTNATIERIPGNCGSLVDIGCGDGTYTQKLKQAFPQMKVLGLDAAAAAVNLAQAKYPEIEFRTADVTEPLPLNETFDVAVVRGLLHHTADPEAALRNISRAASRIIMIEPNGNNPVLKIIEKVSPYHRAHEERSFSAGLLRKWCEEAGLRVISLDYVNFVPFFCPELLARVIYFFQPFLEKLPLLRNFLSGQIVMTAETRS